MTNFLAVCEELVAALDLRVVLTDGYGPITSLVLRIRSILTKSNNPMTENLPRFGTPAYCASKFANYPPMTNLSPAAQAVMTAGTMGNPNVINDPVYRQCIAAALRAAADQVIPEVPLALLGSDYQAIALQEVRAEFIAIAAELEGTSD